MHQPLRETTRRGDDARQYAIAGATVIHGDIGAISASNDLNWELSSETDWFWLIQHLIWTLGFTVLSQHETSQTFGSRWWLRWRLTNKHMGMIGHDSNFQDSSTHVCTLNRYSQKWRHKNVTAVNAFGFFWHALSSKNHSTLPIRFPFKGLNVVALFMHTCGMGDTLRT